MGGLLAGRFTCDYGIFELKTKLKFTL